MTVICAFNEIDGLTTVSNASRLEVSTSTTYGVITGVSRAAFGSDLNNLSMTRDLGQVVTEGWAHVRLYPRNDYPGTGSNAGNLFSLLDENNSVVAAIYADSQGSAVNPFLPLGIRVNGVGGLSAILFSAGTGSSNLLDIDIHFRVADSGGFYRVYFSGALVYEFLGDTRPTASTGIRTVQFDTRGCNSSSVPDHTYFSQVIVSTSSTIGARVHTLALSAGSVNDWTGAVTDINEPTDSPASLISTATNGAEILMAAGDVSGLLTGNVISALVMSSSAQAVIGSPVTNLAGRVKLGATTYDLGTVAPLVSGFRGVQHILGTNPATALPWQIADVNGAEIGLQART